MYLIKIPTVKKYFTVQYRKMDDCSEIPNSSKDADREATREDGADG